MSLILDFYQGGADDRGRRLADILAWGPAGLERTHDYIQWLFPLPEPSSFNPSAPVLTPADAAAFRSTPDLQARMRSAFALMLSFYGFDPPGPQPWLSPGDHNYLRLTRILRSLRLAGLDAEAQRLFAHLQETYRRAPARIGAVTFGFWQRAAQSPLPF